jgi:hypothetical protein
MNWSSIGLSLRLGRFELITFTFAILGLVVASVIAGAWIDSLRPPASCFGAGDLQPAGCRNLLNAWYSAQGATTSLLSGLLVVVSFAAGLFLGAPLIARELERGTVRLAWSLGPSRIRWLLARVVPVLVALATLTVLAGVALDRILESVEPDLDLGRAFVAFGFRGLLVASRSIFIFAVGLAAGAIVGRSLPAIIVGAVIAYIGLAGGEAVHQRILTAEAVVIGAEQGSPGDMHIAQRFRLPDGSLVGYEHFNDREPFDAEGNPLYPMVMIGVPGDRYREVELREALVLASGSLAGLLIAGIIVTRRRPG